MAGVPAAHKHGGKGATEARRVFGVELRTWKREQGDRFGGSGLMAGGCEEWLVGRQTDDNKGGGQSGGKGT